MLAQPITTPDHKRGNARASTILLEYGDYECPFCGEAYPIIKKIVDELQNTLCFVFRNFPLSDIHPNALHAAYAAEAAGKQDRFWHMHDMLYEHQDHLEDKNLLSYAQELGLNREKFHEDFTSSDIAKKVQNEYMGGIRSGVNGTPTFFINGIRFDKGYSYDVLRNALHQDIRAHRYG
jgi:protein-disulfide isomerase